MAFLYMVNSWLSPEVTATSTNVSNLINFWNIKLSAAGAFTTGMIYHRIYVMAFERYNKKLQGKVAQ